jgi:tetratricopeptide (TPR) repeat protein
MKLLILALFTLLAVIDLDRISTINSYKETAKTAFESSDYEGAVKSYHFLIDSLGVIEDPLYINLANAYFHQSDTANAAYYYTKAIDGNDTKLISQAYTQLGVISKWKNSSKIALNQFKMALKTDPSNETARYNYELLKKLMKNQEQQNKKDNKDVKPSEYAKKLKKQADALVNINRFNQAHDIMKKGLEVDKTVSAYNDYIKRLKDVVESKQ